MALAEQKRKVLVVDDERYVRESLQLVLSKRYNVEIAENGSQALELLRSLSGEAGSADEDGGISGAALPQLVLLDIMMPGVDGIEILKQLRSEYPVLPVVMLTASNAVKNAVQAMKIGAVDYLSKPFDAEELVTLLDQTIDQSAKARENVRFLLQQGSRKSQLSALPGDFGLLVGKHPLMNELYRKIQHVAQRDTTVLITGESGTGKELIAREIHNQSSRAQASFVAINCAAIPETLIESELFGHEKGAFTHAMDRRVGYFELADRGTLFLDEIGELSNAVQVKIMRVLQEQEFYRVGRSKPIHVDVRVIAATNRSLERAIEEGRFRQDLYYRINVVRLEMPPLRDRREDIPSLVGFFVRKLSPLYGNRLPEVTEEAIRVLSGYSWPGNVRELENVVESVLALSTSLELGAGDLPGRLCVTRETGAVSEEVLDGRIQFEEAERAFEKDLILKALQKTNYVQTRAAELLGISRRILKYKMDKLGISERTGAQTLAASKTVPEKS